MQAANLDYMPAKNKVGDCYFNGYGTDENKQVAMGFYAEAAQAGNSDAMVNLGSIYLKGIPEIIQKSYKKAFDFFQEATKKENTTAMIHLSEMYRQGLGVPVNEEIATALLEQAAENKNATALFLLKQQNTTFKSRVLFEQLDN